ncbi:hypothetical protein OSTOST_04424, partial [Ostertagia ostertagi]
EHNCCFRIPDHLLRQDICVYLQLLPICGFLSSTVLLLSLAVDRLMSLRKIYLLLDKKYRVAYTIAQITVVLLYIFFVGIWTLIKRTTTKRVFCVITAPLTGNIYTVCMMSIAVIRYIDCHLLHSVHPHFEESSNQLRHYEEYLPVTSSPSVLQFVFGSLSTTVVGSLVEALQLNIERADVDLVAGLFINSSCSVNFFILYTTSKDYRRIFQEHLFCTQFKSNDVARGSDIFTMVSQARVIAPPSSAKPRRVTVA